VTDSKNDLKSKTERIAALDVFRGVAVILAILNHYGYLLTNWYAGFVKVHHFNDPSYASHHEAYGQGRLLVLDDFSQTLNENLGPWVNHLYLFLAGFNIAMRDREGVRAVLGSRLKVFLALFVFFTLETAITSQSVGESFSIYPLHMWMIVLSLLNVVYVYWGGRGAAVLFGCMFLRFVLPVSLVSDGLEDWMQQHFQRNWEYDARLEYFAGTGALGLLFGALYRGRWTVSQKFRFVTIGCSFAFIVLFLLFGALPQFDRENYYAIEHFWIRTISGSLFIYSCCVFFTGLFLLLDKHLNLKNVPVLTWVGCHSLFVFAFHRILFVHVLMPLHEWWLAQQGLVLTFSFATAAWHVVACLVLTWGLQKLRVFEIVAGAGSPRS
jgi:hypothetical protein